MTTSEHRAWCLSNYGTEAEPKPCNCGAETRLLTEDRAPIREVPDAQRKAWEPRRSGYTRGDYERDRRAR